jgi:hypothetical protein
MGPPAKYLQSYNFGASVADMRPAVGAELVHCQDMVGIGANLLPLTGGGAVTATSSITLTGGTETSPSKGGSRPDGWVKKRFTLRVVTCATPGAL